MAQTFFNNSTTLECPSLGNEKDKNNKDVPIINLGNQANKNDCLVNLTEFHGDIKHYLAPENKWEFATLIVPTVRDNVSNRTQYEKQRASLLEDIAKLQEAETPQQGDKAIQDWLKAKYPAVNITDMGYQCGDFRCLVFAFKRTENRFDPALLTGSVVAPIPAPQPDTVANAFVPSMPEKKAPEVEIISAPPKEPEQHHDPMIIDDDETPKKTEDEPKKKKKNKRPREEESSDDEKSSSVSEKKHKKKKSKKE